MEIRKLMKLVPALAFLLASFCFIMPLPVQPAPQGNDAPSMSGNSYSFRSAMQKQDFSFAPLKWVVPSISAGPLLSFSRTYQINTRLAGKYRYVYTAIRAPPSL